MDEATKWDFISDLDYTPWDDQIGGPSETSWDLLPSVIGRTTLVIWQQVVNRVRWA